MTRRRRFLVVFLTVLCLGLALCVPSLAALPSEDDFPADVYATGVLVPGAELSLEVPVSDLYWGSPSEIVVARLSVLQYPVVDPGEPPDIDGLLLGTAWYDSVGNGLGSTDASYYFVGNEPFVTIISPPAADVLRLECYFYNDDSNYGDAIVQAALYHYDSFESFLAEEYAMRDLLDRSSYLIGRSEGYDAGFEQGQQFGFDDGYAEASSRYSAVREEGYRDGYSDGLSTADVGNFSSLFDSVVSAPVNTFASMFNFELLGVNLASLFFFVFTILFIFAILSLIRRLRS